MTALAVAAATGLVLLASASPSGAATNGQGFRVAADDGSVYSFGDAKDFGDVSDLDLNAPVLGLATTPSGDGYWLVGGDGGIFTKGDAGFFGSTGNVRLNAPVLALESTPSGKGYWLVAADGGVFSFGDAAFYGSTGNVRLNAPVLTIEATPSGKGYWLVAADGGIFSFGDAQFYGSTGNLPLNEPVLDFTVTPSGKGYWLVAADGGIFAFGDAPFYGSRGGAPASSPAVVGIDTTPTGKGYYLLDEDGEVFRFGDAAVAGRVTSGQLGDAFAVGIAVTPDAVVEPVVDNTAPVLTASSPVSSASNVPVSTSPSATYGEALAPGSTAVVTGPTGGSVPGTASVQGSTVTFDPTDPLDRGVTYTATFRGRDAAGNSSAATSVTFTTSGDASAPTFVSSSPADNANAVPVTSTVAGTFGEPLAGGSSVLLTVKGSPVAVNGATSVAGSTVSFDPAADLAASSQYVATLTGTDANGNSSSTVIEFVTAPRGAEITFGGFTDLVSAESRLLTVNVTARGLADDELVNYVARLVRDAGPSSAPRPPVVGQSLEACSDPACTGPTIALVTDENGEVRFGSPMGNPVSDTGIQEAGGTTTTFRVAFRDAGEDFALTVELRDADAPGTVVIDAGTTGFDVERGPRRTP